MKFSKSLFSFCILSFILVLSCSTEEVQDTTPPPSIIQTPQPETPAPIENYFSINVIGNGTYQRPNSPYPPLEYEIELISGNKNENGNYSKGSIIRLSAKENPGWELDYPENPADLNEDIIVEIFRLLLTSFS